MEVDEYISKQKSPQKEILARLRGIILKTLKGTDERMRWGVPVYDGGRFYIVGLKDSVNLGLAVKGLPDSVRDKFSGKGDSMRHIKYKRVEDIDEKKIADALKLIHSKVSCQE